MLQEKDIAYETPCHKYWVLKLKNGHFEVYKAGITHSVRVSQIGWSGEVGLNRAIAECNRRLAQDKA